ncbi:Lrp/AsnC family transcriptional regulator [Tenacibaculum ovolyticum]|uniref:Lrp/AsnC family transcriptional regulator n=1 Tax=Tenacibaculum ovolyticum TaxID=104270 RepID=UPI00040F6992|nr:Lrp/AsnC family transcriptional regulator [Tenacibaculum ovolyticum]WBX76230.1 Lrp/AsnC family transcriptional regulator [Tenacibaculum ovolyticum]
MKLDQKDIRILTLLQNNARLSNKELAVELDIAPSTCHERLKKLTNEGYFKAFNADLNLKKLGATIEMLVAVRLKRHEREIVNSFIKKVKTIKGIIRFYHLAGDTDFMIHVAVKDSDSLRSFIMDELAGFHNIDHIESSMIYHSECVHNLSYTDIVS